MVKLSFYYGDGYARSLGDGISMDPDTTAGGDGAAASDGASDGMLPRPARTLETAWRLPVAGLGDAWSPAPAGVGEHAK